MKLLLIRIMHFYETRERLLYLLLLLLIVGSVRFAMANGTQQAHQIQQTPDSTNSTDFSRKIKKFDTSFDGIGPRVYFLPPPASADELMSREYLAQQHEAITIPKMLSKTLVLNQLKPTGDTRLDVARYAGSIQSLEGWLLMEIDFAERCGDLARASDMQNLLAYEYFRVGATDRAFEFLEQAQRRKTAIGALDDAIAINYNLATLYGYTDNLSRARALFETTLDHAQRTHNRGLQADVMTRLALVKARQGSYYEAEQDIIIKVIPLYRQLRNIQGHTGRVIAYSTLSDIYRLQNRYPEAQWFLLQAREVAIEENLSQFMPGIIFNLAEVKKSSGNTEVAVDEYKMADEMVSGQKDYLVMRLAIQDALGDIYHGEGKYKEALEALSRFDSLREQLISTDFPF